MRSLKGTYAGNGDTITLPAVTLAADELLAVFMEFDQSDWFACVGVSWNGNPFPTQRSATLRSVALWQHNVELWALYAPGAGTGSIVIEFDGAVNLAVVAAGYRVASTDTIDVSASDATPPKLAGSVPSSGPTALTSQAHELVLGCIGAATSVAFGVYAAPMNNGQSMTNAASPQGNHVREGWIEANAIGSFTAAWSASWPGTYWAAICATFPLP